MARSDVGVTRGGPKRSVVAAPPRAPRSMRRTSTIDSARPDGVRGAVCVAARARDLFTDAGRAVVEVGAARFDSVVSPDGVLRELHAADGRLEGLVARPVASGFRAAALALVPDQAQQGTLLNLLLDDLPGANLVAGYALQRDPSWSRRQIPVESFAPMGDLCAGWAVGATILEAIEDEGTVPSPTTTTVAADPDDPDGWHERETLAPGAMRRARRLDLTLDRVDPPLLRFDVHFRDSYLDAIAGEGALHEYSAAGRYDGDAHRIVAIEAHAHVLPWTECPGALASARRLVGIEVDDLRAAVRSDFVGPSTCTHLNDVLRSLADLPVLAAHLAPRSGPITDEETHPR